MTEQQGRKGKATWLRTRGANAKALVAWERAEKYLRGQTLSCFLVQWRKGTQGCAMKQNGMVEGTARRCEPHWGLEAGLKQIKMAFMKMRGGKQG